MLLEEGQRLFSGWPTTNKHTTLTHCYPLFFAADVLLSVYIKANWTYLESDLCCLT